MNKKTRAAPTLTDEELQNLKEKTTDIPGLIQYAHERGGFSISIDDPDGIKNKAITAMEEQVEIQLEMLHQRMAVLAKQAQELKDRAHISLELFEVSPAFTPIAGQVYHLYARENGERVLSLIAPTEWNVLPFKEFLASVKYLSDKTWHLVSDSANKSKSDK